MDQLTLRTLTAEAAAANVRLTRDYYKSDSEAEATRAQITIICIIYLNVLYTATECDNKTIKIN